jgi:hypothetical protein
MGVWPPSFVLARAYLDQVERARALDGPHIAALRAELKRVEGLSGGARGDALRQLAGQLDNTADAAAKRLAATLRDLAGA